jgi:hypothetical protein
VLAIDFLHKITPKESFWRKNFCQKMLNGGFLARKKRIFERFFQKFSIF